MMKRWSDIFGTSRHSDFRKAVRIILAYLVDLVLPRSCLACGELVAFHDGLCPACWKLADWIDSPLCDKTGEPFSYDLGPGALSGEAIQKPPVFGKMRAVLIYSSIARSLVSGLKYKDRLEFAKTMGRWMARSANELLLPDTIMVPVPLYWRRQLQRRANQSTLLATAMSRITGHRVEQNILLRGRNTQKQVGLSASQRESNVRGAFRVPDEMQKKLKGAHVILVDDVYTTGATLTAATHALKRAGCEKVDVIVFARVVGTTDTSI